MLLSARMYRVHACIAAHAFFFFLLNKSPATWSSLEAVWLSDVLHHATTMIATTHRYAVAALFFYALFFIASVAEIFFATNCAAASVALAGQAAP
jgi:hypothetical protein